MGVMDNPGEGPHVGRHLLQEDTTTLGTTTVTYANFFDDPYNKAMYLVLPLMVLIYGGCGTIYCIAKLRRYAKRKHRERILHRHTDTPITPFIIEMDEDDEDEFIRPRKKKTGITNPLVEIVGKKNPEVISPPLGEPPPYSPEPKASYIDDYNAPNVGYMGDYTTPEIHVFEQPDMDDVHRSAPSSRAGIVEAHELRPRLDPFHMPHAKKKKRLVFIAI